MHVFLWHFIGGAGKLYVMLLAKQKTKTKTKNKNKNTHTHTHTHTHPHTQSKNNLFRPVSVARKIHELVSA